MKNNVRLGVAIAGLFLTTQSSAMDFMRVGNVVMATGEITRGDAHKFANFIHNNKMDDEGGIISLSSPGGNLFEGMALGGAIRKAVFQAMVGRGTTCASACALAFLGGTRSYVTNIGIGRVLERGARLGFHGFSATGDKIVLLNESLDASRIVTALILEYAQRMKEVEIGWLSNALTSSDLVFAKKPRDIRALSITLKDMPNSVPADWSVNACRKVVNAQVPSLDLMGDRIDGPSSAIATSLREELTLARYGSKPVPDSISNLILPFIRRLSDADALELLLGRPFYHPVLESRRVPLHRGAGFYYDECVAIRCKEELRIVLADSVFQRLMVTGFSDQDQMLAMLRDDLDLW